MNNQVFIIRFEGAEAENHELDLRKLGESLVGIEKIITIGLSTVLPGHSPKRGERPPLVVRASMPRRGSFEIEVFPFTRARDFTSVTRSIYNKRLGNNMEMDKWSHAQDSWPRKRCR